MALMVLGLVVLVAPSPASAAPGDRQFATYNMQGAAGGIRWNTEVGELAQLYPITMLQEAGSGPPPPGPLGYLNESIPVRPDPFRPRPNLPRQINHTRWEHDGNQFHVYFHQTDPRRINGTQTDRWQGGRVNLAIVTQLPAQDVTVLENPEYDPNGANDRYRNRRALGVRFNGMWYFNFHGRGFDVGPMIDRVRAFANGAPWALIGDYNLNIINRSDEEARDRTLHLRAGERLVRTGGATYQNHSELDYAVLGNLPVNTPVIEATRPRARGSDHFMIGFREAAANRPPLRPTPTRARPYPSIMINAATQSALDIPADDSLRVITHPQRHNRQQRFALDAAEGAHIRFAHHKGPGALTITETSTCPGVPGIGDGLGALVVQSCGNLGAQWFPQDMPEDDDSGLLFWRNARFPHLCLTGGEVQGPAIAAPCNGSHYQKWWDQSADIPEQWWAAANRGVRLRSAFGTDLMLDAQRGGTSDLTNIVTHPKKDVDNQRWDIQSVDYGDNLVRVRGAQSGRCVDVRESDHASPGSAAVLYDCKDPNSRNDGAGHRWKVEMTQGARMRFHNEATHLCLTAPYAASGGQVTVETCDDTSTRQEWIVERFDGGSGSPLVGKELRIMPLGDSITQGVDSGHGGGYRSGLWETLRDETKEFNYVGSRQSGSLPDPDHEGYPGYTIDTIARMADCSVLKYRPNVVLLHAGTNDMNQGLDLARAPERLERLINQVANDSPGVLVLVAKLILTGKPGLQPRIDAFNAALPEVVRRRRNAGQRVDLIGMDRAVTLAQGVQNDAHPDNDGYLSMAATWADGLRTAAAKDAIAPPAVPVHSGPAPVDGNCGQTALGPGWRAIGVIAPGMEGPAGHTDLVEINGDGRADYVKTFPDGSVQTAINKPGVDDATPHWVDRGIIAPGVGQPDRTVRFADLNGDGRDDYLVVGLRGSVHAYLNLPSTSPSGAVIDDIPDFHDWGVVVPGVDAPRESIRFADIDGDGRDDYLVVGERGSINAYLNNPGPDRKPTWQVFETTWAAGVEGGSRDRLRMADVDGDRKADYLMVGTAGNVHAYLNRGGRSGGGFLEVLNFANVSNYPGDLVTFRDFNGDDKADYVVIYRQGAIRGWLNLGGNRGAPNPGVPGQGGTG